ncbi:MAG: hypothetical protein WC835_03780 [Candidatus Paceibacterota bacterium]|jgi:hypothetical protein
MDGHSLLTKRILLGIVILAAIALAGYAVYVFYFSPTAKDYTQMPTTPEQKLRVLDNLSQDVQAVSTTTASEKEAILNSLTSEGAQGAASSSSVQSSINTDEKLKLLESLLKKTQ